MGNKLNDFRYFTYEEYDKMIDLMLYNVWKNTYISKEDIKQNLFIYIFNLETKIYEKRYGHINNIKGYIVHSLKFKTRTMVKDMFEKFKKEQHIDLVEYGETVEDTSLSNLEQKLVDKIYIKELLDYYEVLEEDRKVLLTDMKLRRRNERYLLNRWLKRKISKEYDKWRIN